MILEHEKLDVYRLSIGSVRSPVAQLSSVLPFRMLLSSAQRWTERRADSARPNSIVWRPCSAVWVEEDTTFGTSMTPMEPISIPITISIWRDTTSSPNQTLQATLDSAPERRRYESKTAQTGAPTGYFMG